MAEVLLVRVAHQGISKPGESAQEALAHQREN
jgi:hypothetical protein